MVREKRTAPVSRGGIGARMCEGGGSSAELLSLVRAAESDGAVPGQRCGGQVEGDCGWRLISGLLENERFIS